MHDTGRNSAGKLRPTAQPPATPQEVEGPEHPMVWVHPLVAHVLESSLGAVGRHGFLLRGSVDSERPRHALSVVRNPLGDATRPFRGYHNESKQRIHVPGGPTVN